MGAAHARSHTQRNGRTMLNINGVNIEYQYDGAHDARPTEHTLHGLDGLNLSGPAKVMDATSDLPHKGVYQCSVTYDENYANLRNVTLVVADGNKVGLYDAQGKALK